METMAFYISRFQPFLEHGFLHRDVGYQPCMRNFIEAGTNISFEDPLRTVVFTERNEASFDSVCCRTGCPKPIGVRVSQCFGNRVECQQVQGLHGSVPHGWNREGSLSPIALENVDTP